MSQVFSEETHRNMLARIPHCTGREISDWLRAVEDGLAYGAPREEAWLAAFGLTLTLVWLYLEFLRLIAILNSND